MRGTAFARTFAGLALVGFASAALFHVPAFADAPAAAHAGAAWTFLGLLGAGLSAKLVVAAAKLGFGARFAAPTALSLALPLVFVRRIRELRARRAAKAPATPASRPAPYALSARVAVALAAAARARR